MTKISRNPSEAAREIYDLIIVGGGIYGVSTSLVASLRGLKTLLLEKNDFGGATTFNSLRIVHGGLRYLQNLDLPRFFESVSERRWFFQNFPGLVKPIPCLMPLYGKGLKRPSIFRIALLLNDLLSWNRNRDVLPEYKLRSGKLLSPENVRNVFPLVDTGGLKGGAVWYDGSMADSQLIVMEMLKRASSLGASALNYCKAEELIIEDGTTKGVTARDEPSSSHFQFRGKAVVNTSGPWSRQLGKLFDKEYPNLFHSSIAWNLLFSREALSDHALAIAPKRPGAPTYFLRPWKGKLLAGTIHEAWSAVEENPKPTEESVWQFLEDLNTAIPNLNLSQDEIVRVYSGLLPAKKEGTNELAVREVILDHGENGGPKGLYSVSGVKFTTAHLVAEKTLKKVFSDIPDVKNDQFAAVEWNDPKQLRSIESFAWMPTHTGNGWKSEMQKIIQNESVIHLEDLLLRRTSIGDNPDRALKVAEQLWDLFDWKDQERISEMRRFKRYYNQ